MSEREKMINGEIYEPFCSELEQDRFRVKELCIQYNALRPDEKEKKQEYLKTILGDAGENSVIESQQRIFRLCKNQNRSRYFYRSKLRILYCNSSN